MNVVCGLLVQNKKILLAQRPLHKNHGGLWEFPGGKVQTTESLEEALVRELSEELGIQTQNWISLGEVKTSSIKLHGFLGFLNSSYIPLEHRAVAWCLTAKIQDFKLCEADKEILRLYSSKIRVLIKQQQLARSTDF